MLITIDSVLDQIRAKLNLSSETEWELLEEIRAHLEDAVDAAQHNGKDQTTALLKAAEDFGLDESAEQLQELHSELEITQVLLLCIAPIVCTVLLRWLIFSAAGTTNGWQTLFSRPVIVTVSLIGLILPLTQLRRWPYASLGWLFFWAISLIFLAFPAFRV